MTRTRNAVSDYMDALRAEDPGMAEVGRLDSNAETVAMLMREILREARLSSGLTLQQMADRLQVTQPTVSAIETGTGNLGVKTIARYLGALDVDLMEVMTAFRQSVGANVASVEEAGAAAAFAEDA